MNCSQRVGFALCITNVLIPIGSILALAEDTHFHKRFPVFKGMI